MLKFTPTPHRHRAVRDGHSGNPAERLRGARNRATLAAEALLAENAEGLTRKLIDDALGGDGQALRFVIARLCPAATGRAITLDLAPGREGDLLHIHALVMRALVDGEITTDEAVAVARVLTAGAKLIELQRKLRKDAGAKESPSPACGRETKALFPASIFRRASGPARADATGARLFRTCISRARRCGHRPRWPGRLFPTSIFRAKRREGQRGNSRRSRSMPLVARYC